MIIATAGHVDHGKTSLIRQLTGVETDRLAEEQRRGLSINLGYAYLPRPQGTPLGFIDVPGHQRFINNMISGISGIDLGMLVVAADDGPMPQTHEHMDVLQLLGIRDLIVVISKTDRVVANELNEVERRIEAILDPRPWSNTPVFPVSNIAGDGIAVLKAHLLKRAAAITAPAATGYFRLSIDRAFTAKGAGLVVTGTAAAGSVSVGDSLQLLPQGVEVRVRGIRVHDEKAETALAGQRCALNIVGKLEAAAIGRGDWLVQPGAAPAGRRLDVYFSLLQSAPFPLKHLSPIKMYIGAKRVAGRIALLDTERDGNRLQPGANCLAQLLLEGDVACFRGERFLLRDHAENVILGGGTILDPDGPRSGKARPERIACLHAMKADSPAAALAELVALNQLVNLDRFRQAWNIREDEAPELTPNDCRTFAAENSNWAASELRWTRTDETLLAYLDNWHLEHPQQPGIKVTELKSALLASSESPLLMAVLTSRLRSGELILSAGRISRANFQPAVSAQAMNQREQLLKLLQDSGNHIPLLSEASAKTGIDRQSLEQVAKKAVKSGVLHSITSQRYALPGQLYTFAGEVISVADSGEPITVIAVKSRFGAGRKLTIEILEYFDRIHFTRRQGDTRILLDRDLPARLFNR